MDTTVTFRTDTELKKQATTVFESLGMSLSTALNAFMRQAVIKQKFPCSLDACLVIDAKSTYPASFFNLFGTGKDLGLDDEPEDLPADTEDISL